MSEALLVRSVDACSAVFATRHGIALPGAGSFLVLEREIARGGFGTLYPVSAIDGARPSKPLLAKLFDAEVLGELGGAKSVSGRIGELVAALERRAECGWSDALLALPVCALTAVLGGQLRLATLMLDLRALGYGASPFIELSDTAAHLARPPRERIELALSYARRAALLEEVALLHPDQNPENLMVGEEDVQIIDLDAAIVVRCGRERPLTSGKPDDCMPPEVKPGGRGAGIDLARFTPAAGRWSVGSLIGYFLFGAHPAFFLRNISRASIEAYSREPAGWPNIDVDGPLFTQLEHNRRAHCWMREQLEALPRAVRTLFRDFFAAGLDGERRPTAAEWVAALAGLREPPVIERFDVDEQYVIEGDRVLLSWEVDNATEVTIDGHGTHPWSGSLSVPVERSIRFELTAHGPYGDSLARTPLVHVLGLPRIDTVPIPGFSASFHRRAASPCLGAPLTKRLSAPPARWREPRMSAVPGRGVAVGPSPFPSLEHVLTAADAHVARVRQQRRRR